MRKRISIFAVPTLTVLTVGMSAGAASASSGWYPPTYGIIDIANAPDYVGGVTATSINQRGQVVGYASRQYGASGFLWEDGTLRQLGPNTEAIKVNSFGRVAGNVVHRYTSGAFTWYDGTFTDLGYLAPVHIGGDTGSAVVADLNDAGQIVGGSVAADYHTHAYRWQDGVMTDLGTLGGTESNARDLNERGDVVGESTTAAGDAHAFFWRDGHMVDLGTLGGKTSRATGVNNRGHVVGVSAVPDGSDHAFLWEDGLMHDLGAVDGDGNSAAVYVNEADTVLVGSEIWWGPAVQAFVWEQGRRTPVGGIGSPLTRSLALNNLGQVVGSAPTSSGQSRAFVWHQGVTAELGTLGGANSVATAVNDFGVVVGAADPADPADGVPHATVWRPSWSSSAPPPDPAG